MRKDGKYGPRPIVLGISNLWGYPYLNGLHYKGVYMGYPYPYFCLCASLGPYSCQVRVQGDGFRGLGPGLRGILRCQLNPILA